MCEKNEYKNEESAVKLTFIMLGYCFEILRSSGKNRNFKEDSFAHKKIK